MLIFIAVVLVLILFVLCPDLVLGIIYIAAWGAGICAVLFGLAVLAGVML